MMTAIKQSVDRGFISAIKQSVDRGFISAHEVKNMSFNTHENASGHYSVDMLIVWANEFGTATKQPIEKYMDMVNKPRWDNGISISDVLSHPKDHASHYKRIKNAQLKYPILCSDDDVVDGYHRIGKAILKKKTYIDVIEVPLDIMKACCLNKYYNAPSKPGGQGSFDISCHELIVRYIKKIKMPLDEVNQKKKIKKVTFGILSTRAS